MYAIFSSVAYILDLHRGVPSAVDVLLNFCKGGAHTLYIHIEPSDIQASKKCV